MNDTIGNCVWACSSGGTVDPSGTTDETSTTLTAEMSPTEDCVVGVIVYDSQTQYNDDGIPLLKTFNIIAPTNFVPKEHISNSTSGWTAGPPNNNIGAGSLFRCEVYPTTVNFYNVEFRETRGTQYWTWPDGSATGVAATTITYWTDLSDDFYNYVVDTSRTALYPISKLDSDPDPNIENYEDCLYSTEVNHQYKNEDDDWTTYTQLPIPHYRQFYSNLTGRMGIDCGFGNLQGPWN